MGAICGSFAYQSVSPDALNIGDKMCEALRARGPLGQACCPYPFGILGHCKRVADDPLLGAQPLSLTYKGYMYTIVYNGRVFNRRKVKAALEKLGFLEEMASDAELLLYAYLAWGEDCPALLGGMYAFALYDGKRQGLFCVRDRLGIKPFYYCEVSDTFYFASEPKALLAAGAKPYVDEVGLWQLLYLAPVLLPGTTVFRDIYALRPAEACFVTKLGIRKWSYWSLEAKRCSDSLEVAVERVRGLVTDAILRQLPSPVPAASLLSGGLDSSVVSAVAAKYYRERGLLLSTYSFEYEDNDYTPTLFQPKPDDAFALEMAAYIGSDHTILRGTNLGIADALLPATLARDMAGQADIDSSLYYFFDQIKVRHGVILSGECADEVFGGYPWFYRPEMLSRDFFPWMHDPHARAGLFEPRRVFALEGYEYLKGAYRRAVASVSVLEDDSPADRQARIATLLSLGYFGASLLERKDRMSMAHGVEARVPFADHRIVEYLYNLPWSYRYHNETEKSLLREAMGGYLPESIRTRKKSPYPKTHSPQYESLIRERLISRLGKEDSPLAPLLKNGAIRELMAGEDITWLGQLMARPQLYAWLYQLDVFFTHYGVTLTI